MKKTIKMMMLSFQSSTNSAPCQDYSIANFRGTSPKPGLVVSLPPADLLSEQAHLRFRPKWYLSSPWCISTNWRNLSKSFAATLPD
jgi:hypothetical protein